MPPSLFEYAFTGLRDITRTYAMSGLNAILAEARRARTREELLECENQVLRALLARKEFELKTVIERTRTRAGQRIRTLGAMARTIRALCALVREVSKPRTTYLVCGSGIPAEALLGDVDSITAITPSAAAKIFFATHPGAPGCSVQWKGDCGVCLLKFSPDGKFA